MVWPLPRPRPGLNRPLSTENSRNNGFSGSGAHFWIWSRRPRAQGVGVDPFLLKGRAWATEVECQTPARSTILVVQGLLSGNSSEKKCCTTGKRPWRTEERRPKHRYCFSCLKVRGGSLPSPLLRIFDRVGVHIKSGAPLPSSSCIKTWHERPRRIP